MIRELQDSINLIVVQTKAHLPILGMILLILLSVFFITRLFPGLLLLGIIPRHIIGLPGILLSPLLHAHFNHLFFNSIPLLVLSTFLLIDGLTYYRIITALITVTSGLLIWCFARPGIHIGASAVVTGYWAFLIMHMYQTGTVTNVILGILSLYYFAGIFMGIFPSQKGVSWEGHLFGLIAGIATSYLVSVHTT